MLDTLRARLVQPLVLLPLLAVLALLVVYGILQLGLAATARWDASLAHRLAQYRNQRATVLVARYEERLHQIRIALRKRGYDAGPVDAAMGPRTADALRAFQERQGLPVTGRPDEATMTALGVEP